MSGAVSRLARECGLSARASRDCRFSQVRGVNHLAPAGEAGAKRRVRDLRAWRHFLAPGIKILMRGAKKIPPRAKVPRPSLSRPGPVRERRPKLMISADCTAERENRQSQDKRSEEH